jgi:hypothetical protein
MVMLKVLCVSYRNIMMLVNFVRIQIFSLHGIRFGRKAFYYKLETEIGRDDGFGSTCELDSQRAGTLVSLLLKKIQALRRLS